MLQRHKVRVTHKLWNMNPEKVTLILEKRNPSSYIAVRLDLPHLHGSVLYVRYDSIMLSEQTVLFPLLELKLFLGFSHLLNCEMTSNLYVCDCVICIKPNRMNNTQMYARLLHIMWHIQSAVLVNEKKIAL